MAIDIERLVELDGIPSDDQLRRFAMAALEDGHVTSAGSDDAAAVQVHLRIVDEAEGRALNYRWRGKDSATNVLSFPSSLPDELPDGTALTLLGDVVLCAPVIAREAAVQNKPLSHHWAHLSFTGSCICAAMTIQVIHGVLHLRGYDHTTSGPAETMEQLERQLLEPLGIPDPYQTQAG